jgi:hypothetical protein
MGGLSDEGSASFLKKRSKKLLLMCWLGNPTWWERRVAA